MAGAWGNTPAQPAAAVARIGRWRGDQPAPLHRLSIPKQNGTPRPRSLPTLADRARPAVSRHALPPMAETTGAQHAYGFRPQRRGADALDQGFQVLRQQTAATGIVEGALQGCFEHMRLAGREAPIPRPKGVWSTGRRSGLSARGPRLATTAGVPHGGMIAPVVSHLGVEGRAAVVHGGRWHRRVHHITDGRWADDGIGTANSRPV